MLEKGLLTTLFQQIIHNKMLLLLLTCTRVHSNLYMEQIRKKKKIKNKL